MMLQVVNHSSSCQQRQRSLQLEVLLLLVMLLFLSVCCSGWAFQSVSTTSSRATRTTPIGMTASLLLSAVGPTRQWCRTPTSTSTATATMTLWATTRGEQQDQQDKSSNTGDNSGGGSSVLVTAQSDTTTTAALFSAFASLDLRDQYDAVLSSACAKLLDGTAAASDNNINNGDAAAATVETKLNDCQRLLQEMNDSNVPASPRSLMALVDATVQTQNAHTMAAVLSQCARNPSGLVAQYGARPANNDLILLPSSRTSKVQTGGRRDGAQTTTAHERLQSIPDLPVDERASEVTAALLFAATVVSCETTNLLGLSDVQPAANILLAAVIGVVAVDNFYDIIKAGSQLLVQQIGQKTGNAGTSNGGTSGSDRILQLPDKDQLPAGLGTGATTGSIVRGLTRLWAVDAEREAANEAAALYTAYTLGLPCFAFRPNAYEAARLIIQGQEESETTTTTTTTQLLLLNEADILRMLVWLLAPVAMESSKHAQLLLSDPREAQGFLTRLEEHFGPDNELLFWNNNDDNNNNNNMLFSKNDVLKWAYAEADRLLRDNKTVVQEIANRLSGGAATVGDCVAVIENWY